MTVETVRIDRPLLTSIHNYNDVHCRELAPGAISLTGDRVQGDDSKQCAYSSASFVF